MKLTSRDMPRSYWRKVAARNNILPGTFNYRIRAGWSPRDAATKPLDRKPPRKGAKQLCREAGLHEESIYKYRKKRDGAPDLTDEQIIDRIKAWHDRVSISELARQSGISRATISRRLAEGKSIREATTAPPKRPRVRPGSKHHWREKWEPAK